MKADKFTLQVSRGTSVVLLLVYILYIIFQLKSHAYLYASIPQQIIDEESHPGVLADLMNSSSDSSSSSSDESDDTTTSWTTAKRIKRAMKYRRRRKSSTSSKGTSSHQSIQKRLTSDLPSGSATKSASFGGSSSSHQDLPGGPLAVDFGDDARYEADTDAPRSHEPQTRDFGHLPTAKALKDERKSKRRAQKREKRAEDQDLTPAAANAPVVIRPSLKSHQSSPAHPYGTATTVEGTSDQPKPWSSFRPNFPSLLTNTVFSNPQAPSPVTPGEGGNTSGLRRTHSLPSHMNRPPPVGNAVQFARGAARMPTAVDPSAPAPPEHPEPEMSRTAAVVMLMISTALVAVCAEFLVDAIPAMIESSNVSEAFIGLIILPIVGNAAEHVTAVSVATKNKMDLSIGVSVGSSIQIGAFLPRLL